MKKVIEEENSQKRKADVAKARERIAQGASGNLLAKWEKDIADGKASPQTIDYVNKLKKECSSGIVDCLGICDGTAIKDKTQMCCNPEDMVEGACFGPVGYDALCATPEIVKDFGIEHAYCHGGRGVSGAEFDDIDECIKHTWKMEENNECP